MRLVADVLDGAFAAALSAAAALIQCCEEASEVFYAIRG